MFKKFSPYQDLFKFVFMHGTLQIVRCLRSKRIWEQTCFHSFKLFVLMFLCMCRFQFWITCTHRHIQQLQKYNGYIEFVFSSIINEQKQCLKKNTFTDHRLIEVNKYMFKVIHLLCNLSYSDMLPSFSIMHRNILMF